MQRLEADLGTRREWVAVDHWDTDNPHVHVVLRGRGDTGANLVIARDFLTHGMRRRASELVTERLGPRTELEVQSTLQVEVQQARWTSLDRALASPTRDQIVETSTVGTETSPRSRSLLIGRLQYLETLGLARRWTQAAGDCEPTPKRRCGRSESAAT
jgi:type IV secretory pathway VirD2 relaxase